jgi:small subunit ribosomal protein S24e
VNNRKREVSSLGDGAVVEKQLVAFQEKRQNVSAVGATAANAPMYLMGTTKLDPMTYVLFGAFEIKVTSRGLECDEWLPIVGNVYVLDDLSRLKSMIEECMLRVFEGLMMQKQRRPRVFAPVASRDEEEYGDDDENRTVPSPLSAKEIQELDYMTKHVVGILDRFGEDFVASQSRANSRPVTPSGSPLMSSTRLLQTRSGTSTPWGPGTRSAYNSRPGTPSLLARGLR